MRYIDDSSGDIQLDWTHLNTYDNAMAIAPSSTNPPGLTPALGPSFLIGPPPPYTSANAVAHFAFDAVNFDAGLLFRAGKHVQMRTFAGVQGARISQSLSTDFQNPDGSISFTNVSKSVFTGAGPRLGMEARYNAGCFDFLGGIAGSAIIGNMQSSIDFVSTSPIGASLGFSPNSQFLTSPGSTRVIPGIDARLGGSYTIPVGNFGIFKCEAGYQAAVYFDAVNQFSLTEVVSATTDPFEGRSSVFLRTAVEFQSNFVVHGPYVRFSLQF